MSQENRSDDNGDKKWWVRAWKAVHWLVGVAVAAVVKGTLDHLMG